MFYKLYKQVRIFSDQLCWGNLCGDLYIIFRMIKSANVKFWQRELNWKCNRTIVCFGLWHLRCCHSFGGREICSNRDLSLYMIKVLSYQSLLMNLSAHPAHISWYFTTEYHFVVQTCSELGQRTVKIFHSVTIVLVRCYGIRDLRCQSNIIMFVAKICLK
jgi:hypothetical protein